MGLANSIRQRVEISRPTSVEPVDAADCMIVEQAASTSPAGLAGIKQGDLLLRVGNQPASQVDLAMRHAGGAHVTYLFRTASGEHRQLTTSLYPIGVNLADTNETIMRRFDSGAADYDELDTLWERGQWALLEKAARKQLRPGLLLRLILWSKGRSVNDSPASLMLGAAFCEQGKWQPGLKYVREFCQKYENHWTTQYHAIARYYLAIDAEQQGDSAQALELLQDAFEYSSFDRIADKIGQLTGTRPQEETMWQGRQFPIGYRLPDVHTGDTVSLADRLATLKQDQLLVVCSLANYRANGPYDDFIRTCSQWLTSLNRYIAEVHVLTMSPQPDDFSRNWLGAEEAARAAGLPIKVLAEEGEVTSALEPTVSPYILLLTRDGGIIQEGEPDNVELWQMLARLDERNAEGA